MHQRSRLRTLSGIRCYEVLRSFHITWTRAWTYLCDDHGLGCHRRSTNPWSLIFLTFYHTRCSPHSNPFFLRTLQCALSVSFRQSHHVHEYPWDQCLPSDLSLPSKETRATLKAGRATTAQGTVWPLERQQHPRLFTPCNFLGERIVH